METETCHQPCAVREEARRLGEEVKRLMAEREVEAAKAAEQAAKLADLQGQLEVLKRRVFGHRSEKMPSPGEALRRQDGTDGRNGEAAQQKRREHEALRAKLPRRRLLHPVPPGQRICPHCGCALKPVGTGRRTELIEYIAERLECQEHVQETLACPHCDHIVTAPPPVRVVEQGEYGPGLMAHLIVAKCADGLPWARLEKQFRRLGIPLNRSTINDQIHRWASEWLKPLYERIHKLVAVFEIVLADETRQPVQALDQTRQGWIWTFLAGPFTAYVYSPSRSGETPAKVLGASKGTLVVDAYTGYNRVTTPTGRVRAGCLAHARRGFFEALPTAPGAQFALDRILEVYRVEHEALAQGIVRTPAHLHLRQTRSRAAMDALHTWLIEQQPLHPPKSPLSQAIGYALNQWEALTRFLDDVRLPPDNNASERALRRVAQGRKVSLFVGNDQAGEHLAGLWTLVATCEANGVNPEAYLADVLLRVQTHPQSRLDDLLPHRWQPLPSAPPPPTVPSPPPAPPTPTLPTPLPTVLPSAPSSSAPPAPPSPATTPAVPPAPPLPAPPTAPSPPSAPPSPSPPAQTRSAHQAAPPPPVPPSRSGRRPTEARTADRSPPGAKNVQIPIQAPAEDPADADVVSSGATRPPLSPAHDTPTTTAARPEPTHPRPTPAAPSTADPSQSGSVPLPTATASPPAVGPAPVSRVAAAPPPAAAQASAQASPRLMLTPNGPRPGPGPPGA